MLVLFVVVWGVWLFYWVVFINVWYGVVMMDMLILVGVSVVYLWLLWVLFFGDVGMLGMCMIFILLFE